MEYLTDNNTHSHHSIDNMHHDNHSTNVEYQTDNNSHITHPIDNMHHDNHSTLHNRHYYGKDDFIRDHNDHQDHHNVNLNMPYVNNEQMPHVNNEQMIYHNQNDGFGDVLTYPKDHTNHHYDYGNKGSIDIVTDNNQVHINGKIHDGEQTITVNEILPHDSFVDRFVDGFKRFEDWADDYLRRSYRPTDPDWVNNWQWQDPENSMRPIVYEKY